MTLDVGGHLGRYEILSHLGKGGMGEVYRALDRELGREVAVKVLHAEFSSDRARLSRFKQEAQSLARLNQPNILTILDVGTHEGSYYVVSELLEGETLHKLLSSRTLSQHDAIGYALKIAQGLIAAHEKGIIHRDLKPENIFVTQDGQVKILDFGLAKLSKFEITSGFDTEGETIPAALTQQGIVLGTIGYMSPEQAQGKNDRVDYRSDIFSFGAILYEMLAGHPAFRAQSNVETLHAIIKEDPPQLSGINSKIDPAVEQVLRHCLEKRPKERYQSARDLVFDLKMLSAGSLPAYGGEAPISTSVKRSGILSGPAEEIRTRPTSAILTSIRQRLGRTLVASGMLVLIVFVAGYFYFTRSNNSNIDSIAVLPFVNVGADSDTEYLSDGITESIISSLSHLPNLSVIARSSVFRYKGQQVDPQAAGQQLKVRAVLMGRVVQRGDNLSIDAELVDVSNNHRIWGEQYSRKLSEVIAVPSEISRGISEKLRSTLSGEEKKRVTKNYTENSEAYQLYLKGRYYWNKRTGEDIKKGIQYFDEAIAADPTYALAYAGLAECYNVIWVYTDIPSKEAHQKAKAAALQALKLDETLAEAHSALSTVKADDEWDFAGAENEIRQAIKLNPNYATAYQRNAEHLSPLGRHAEATASMKHAQELDPLSLIINTEVGGMFVEARQYDEGIDEIRKAIELDKSFFLPHFYLREAYLGKGMYEEAIAEDAIAVTLTGGSPDLAAKRTARLKQAYATAGVRGYWQERLNLAKEALKQDHTLPAIVVDTSPYYIASLYARLGENDQAFEWLQKAYDKRDSDIVYFKIAPQFDGLRSDPRAVDLMRRIGFPQ